MVLREASFTAERSLNELELQEQRIIVKRHRHNNQANFNNTIKMVTLSFLGMLLISTKFAQALNSVLDLENTFPYLLNKTSDGKMLNVIEPRDYMDFENLYAPNLAYRLNQTSQGRNYHLIKAFDFANYFQSDYWHYSSEKDLIESAMPVANENKCEQQLTWLIKQLNSSDNLFKPGEQHVNLMTLIDAFGKPETNTYLGHGYWIGSYYECLKASINLEAYEFEECRSNKSSGENCIAPSDNTGELIKGRFCIGKVRDIDWPKNDNYRPAISYKVGLCLPETCQTLSFKRHAAMIEQLMKFSFPSFYKNRLTLNEIYCVPDERSPIRQLPLSSRVFLIICSAWCVCLLVATAVYSLYQRHRRDLKSLLKEQQQQHQNGNHHLTITIDNNDHSHGGSIMMYNKVNGNNNNNNHSGIINKNNNMIMISNNNNNSPLGECLPSCPASPTQSKAAQFKGVLSSGAQLLLIKTQASISTALSPVHSPKGYDDEDDDDLADGMKHNTFKSNSNTISPYKTTPGETSSTACSSSSASTSTLSNWLDESPTIMKFVKALSVSENLKEFQKPPAVLRNQEDGKRVRVNLNALDSIKCLCCIMVIFGHIVFINMQHLSNIIHTIELSNQIYPRILIAFFNFVDTFFIISGMLTSYFIFKRFNAKSFSSPLIWLNISLLRLLRLSPVYLLVFWFSKTMTVYIADGPIWDYGTDRLSNKGMCINDHWWKSLLYLGNVGTMQPLCILPAWSIIVDSQYSLVIPPLLYIIFKRKRIGYLCLLLAVVLSTGNMSYMLANQTAVKTSDMAKVRLHVYPLISRFAAEFYNTAWNRIGPVAIGIIGGHMLYLYEIMSIRRWPWFMRGLAFKFILFLHLLIFTLPLIGRFTDNPETSDEADTTIFVLSNATIKPVWSIINTIFLLRIITDLRSYSVMARLMSHNLWHCLGKLCFASYLIHYELILVLLKSRHEGLIDANWSNLLREFSITFLISTLLSYLVYIFYESPINMLISLCFMGPKRKYEANNSMNNANNNEQFRNHLRDQQQGGKILNSCTSKQ